MVKTRKHVYAKKDGRGRPRIYPWDEIAVDEVFKFKTRDLWSARMQAAQKRSDLKKVFFIYRTTAGIFCVRRK